MLDLIKASKVVTLLDNEGIRIKTRENRSVLVEDFSNMFAGCELTYESLRDKAQELDNGWVEIFDEWNSQGIFE